MERQILRITFDEVYRVSAFKTDEGTYDTIWIEFECVDGAMARFCDESEGWSEALSKLPTCFSERMNLEHWFFEVAFPAFAQNHRVLFTREAG